MCLCLHVCILLTYVFIHINAEGRSKTRGGARAPEAHARKVLASQQRCVSIYIYI